MEENKYQKELFEFEKQKKPFPRFGRIFLKGDFGLTFSMEHLVFISIGLIMLMVIIYALGVERGKSLRPQAIIQNRVVSQAPVEPKPIQQEHVVPTPVHASAKTKPAQETDKPYTIVAVTFVRKDTALAEVNRLKKEGFESFIAESDSYFLVCVGAYTDKEGAKPTLSKVKKLYKDAYLKLR